MAVAGARAPMAKPQSFARGGVLNLVGAGANAVFTFLLVFVLTKRVGQDEVGAFMIGVAALTILSQATQLGTNTGLMRFVPLLRVRGQGRALRPMLPRVLLPVLLAGTCAGIVVGVFASSMAQILGGDADALLAVEYLRLFAPFVPFAGLFLVASQFSQAFSTMTPAVTVDKIGRAMAQLLGVGVCASWGAVAIVGAYGVAFPVGLGLLWIWNSKLLRRWEDDLPAESSPSPSLPIAEFWRFTGPRAISTTFQVTILWADTILIGFLRSVEDAAVYSVATRYLALGHLVIGALLQAMSPRLAAFLAAGSMERAHALYQRTATWIVSAVWPTYLSVAIFAPWLLQLFGPGYVRGATALRIVALAMMVAAASGPVDNVLLMAGKSWISVVNWGVALVVNIACNLVLIPVWGIEGAAIAWAASILVRNVAPAIEVYYMFGIHPFTGTFVRVSSAAVLAVGGGSLLGVAAAGQGIWSVLIGGLPGWSIFLLLLSMWRRSVVGGDVE